MDPAQPDSHPEQPRPASPVLAYTRRLFRSWFELNWDEQRILVIILALFLTGLIVRLWHEHRSPAPPPPPPAGQVQPAQP